MSTIDPIHKWFIRSVWRSLQTGIAAVPSKGSGSLAVWYGGARAGDVGGPLVKVQRLKQHFPEHRIGYSVVYALSNTPYLSGFALRLLRWRGIPLVLNQNGVFYSGWFDGNWTAKNREMARAWQAADYVFCQSAFCRQCAEQFLGPRQGPVEILFNAVDLSYFTPASEKALATRTKPVFLMTGKIDDHMFYRVAATLRAFALAVDQGMVAHLTLSGWISPTAIDLTDALAAELGISDHVTLTGPYTQAAAPPIYRAADVYVMLKHNDPCPNTVLEALACGLPVLYSASGGVPELASGLSGLGLPVTQGFDANYVPDTKTTANGMVEILTNLPARRQAARARAEEAFNLKHWIVRHREVFQQLCQRQAS